MNNKSNDLEKFSQKQERELLISAGIENYCKGLPEFPSDAGYIISPDNKLFSGNYIYVKAESIDHLRKICGVPCENTDSTIEIKLNLLPRKKKIDVSTLSNDSFREVRKMATKILLGHVNSDELTKLPYVGIQDYMLEEASNLPVFIAQDLIIKDGEIYVLKKTASAVFNNIIIYGSGEIKLESDMKIIANSIKHI